MSPLSPLRQALPSPSVPGARRGARFRAGLSRLPSSEGAGELFTSVLAAGVDATDPTRIVSLTPLESFIAVQTSRLKELDEIPSRCLHLATAVPLRARPPARPDVTPAPPTVIKKGSSMLALRLARPQLPRCALSLRSFSTSVALCKKDKAIDTRPARVLTFKTQSGLSSFKTFLPVTPSLRQLRQPIVEHLHKGDPLRALTIGKRSSGGRNNTGRITVRARGGGHKRRLRLVDFVRKEEGEQDVQRIEYDPGRSAHIALIRHRETGGLSYILAPKELRMGDVVQSFRSGIPASFTTTPDEPTAYAAPADPTNPASPQSVLPPPASVLPGSVPVEVVPTSQNVSVKTIQRPQIDQGVLRSVAIRPGNCLPLRLIPVGTIIHGITLSPTGPAILARSAGASARIIGASTANDKFAQVKLNSGEVRLVGLECLASIGIVSNADHQHENLGKAGRMRWLGFRPLSRGMAQNACVPPFFVVHADPAQQD